jgi:hypothetical protein
MRVVALLAVLLGAVAALVVAEASAPVVPRSGAVYLGRTSQGEVAAFRISANGQRIRSTRVVVRSRCRRLAPI